MISDVSRTTTIAPRQLPLWGLLLLLAAIVGLTLGASVEVHRMSLSTFEEDFQPGHCATVAAYGPTADGEVAVAETTLSGKVVLELPPGAYSVEQEGLVVGDTPDDDPMRGRPCTSTSNGLGGPVSSFGIMFVSGWGQHLTLKNERVISILD